MQLMRKARLGECFEPAAPIGNGKYEENVLWNFSGTDQFPGNLILDSAGNLYGTFYSGGSNGYGLAFEATP